MMNILGIDSSSRNLSVAVSRDDKLLSEVINHESSKHMVNIIKFADKALYKAGLSIKDIDVFGANLGPGDFTGTRIGASVIKTLSWVEKKCAYGINSLDVHAVMCAFKNKNIISKSLLNDRPVAIAPCLDVKRSEVYFSFYGISEEENDVCHKAGKKIVAGMIIGAKKYNIKRIGDYHLANKDELIEKFSIFFENEVLKIQGKEIAHVNPAAIVCGSSCVSHKSIMLDLIRSSSFILDKRPLCSQARYVNLCSYFSALEKVEPKNLVPVYVRDFVPFGN